MNQSLVMNGYRAMRDPIKIPPYIQRKIYKKLFSHLYSPLINREGLKQDNNIDYFEVDQPEEHTIHVSKSGDPNVVDAAINRWTSYLPNNRKIWNRSEESDQVTYSVYNYPPFVAEVDEVTLYGPYGLIKTKDDRFPTEIRGSSDQWATELFTRTLQDWGLIRTLRLTTGSSISPQNKFDTATTILNARRIPSRMAYGHWLLEVIPRVRGVQSYSKSTNNNPTYLVDPHIADWQKNLLYAVGVNKESIVTWNGEPSTINKFILPKWGKNEYCKSDLLWMAESMKRKFAYEKHIDKFPSRVYLSRTNMSRRRIINEDELLNSLESYGFKMYEPSKMSIPEQIALFEAGDIFLGPNGSAFANMIFSQNSHTIQMYPPDFLKLRLYEVNNILGHETHYILGDEKISGYGHESDFTVNVEKVSELIDGII